MTFVEAMTSELPCLVFDRIELDNDDFFPDLDCLSISDSETSTSAMNKATGENPKNVWRVVDHVKARL